MLPIQSRRSAQAMPKPPDSSPKSPSEVPLERSDGSSSPQRSQAGTSSPKDLFYVPTPTSLTSGDGLPPLEPGFHRLFFTEHPENVKASPDKKTWETPPSVVRDISADMWDGSFFQTRSETRYKGGRDGAFDAEGRFVPGGALPVEKDELGELFRYLDPRGSGVWNEVRRKDLTAEEIDAVAEWQNTAEFFKPGVTGPLNSRYWLRNHPAFEDAYFKTEGLDRVNAFLKAGIPLDTVDAKRQAGWALRNAVIMERKDIIEALLAKKDLVKAPSVGCALFAAAKRGNKDIVQALLNAGYPVDTIDARDARRIAKEEGYMDVVQALDDKGCLR